MVSGTGESPRLLLLGDARQVHLKRWADHFVGAGFEVLTFTLERPDQFPGTLKYIRMPGFLPRILRYVFSVPAVKALVENFKPHVVNAHYASNYGVIAALVGRRPWVLSTWGSDVMTDPLKGVIHRMRLKSVLRRAAWITSDAQVMTDKIISMGIAAENVLTFPYGVDTSLFCPADKTPDEGPRIVSNRKLEPVYSVSTIIDAFPAVRETFNGATLTVAGEGSLRSDLAQRAERSIARRAIIFVGGVDHDRMPALLRDNHIYVSLSLSDTTSVSLLEAMACGLFPVVSDIPANREWIEHGSNGYLVPVQQPMKLARTLINAWKDGDLRREAARTNLDTIRRKAEWTSNMEPVGQLFGDLAAGA
jgi:glycosyltransferase involved in cell wall biosynthesis